VGAPTFTLNQTATESSTGLKVNGVDLPNTPVEAPVV
jgi:hypothetical protein